MANTVFFVIVGFGLIVLGVHFIGQPTLSDLRFGVINTGEHHVLIGCALVVVGAVVLFFVLKSVLKRSRE